MGFVQTFSETFQNLNLLDTGTQQYFEDFITSIDADWDITDQGSLVIVNDTGAFGEDVTQIDSGNIGALYLKDTVLSVSQQYSEIRMRSNTGATMNGALGIRTKISPTPGDGWWIRCWNDGSFNRFSIWELTSGSFALKKTITLDLINANTDIHKIIGICSGSRIDALIVNNAGTIVGAIGVYDTGAPSPPGSVGLGRLTAKSTWVWEDHIRVRDYIADDGTWVRYNQSLLSDDDTGGSNIYGRKCAKSMNGNTGWLGAKTTVFDEFDQRCKVEYYTSVADPSGGGVLPFGCLGRFDTSSRRGYLGICFQESSGAFIQLRIYRVINGIQEGTPLASFTSASAQFALNTLYRTELTCEGTTITLRLLDSSDIEIETLSVTNSFFTDGVIGIMVPQNLLGSGAVSHAGNFWGYASTGAGTGGIKKYNRLHNEPYNNAYN